MKLYHTVEERNNTDQVEKNSPFKCTRSDAWLGEGYYLWDTFIENAHWWGSHAYPNNYIIVEHEADSIQFSPRCFDLHGNMNHVREFDSIYQCLSEEKIFSTTPTVPTVIRYLQAKTDFLSQYDGIRANALHSKSHHQSKYIFFKANKNCSIELTPPIQVCLFRKNAFRLKTGKIVFPDHYVDDYVL